MGKFFTILVVEFIVYIALIVGGLNILANHEAIEDMKSQIEVLESRVSEDFAVHETQLYSNGIMIKVDEKANAIYIVNPKGNVDIICNGLYVNGKLIE